MDKSFPAMAPMVVRWIDLEKDIFRPRDKGEEILGSEFPYLSLIGALMWWRLGLIFWEVEVNSIGGVCDIGDSASN